MGKSEWFIKLYNTKFCFQSRSFVGLVQCTPSCKNGSFVLLFAHQCKSTKIRSTCPRNKFWCEIGLGIPWIPTKVPMSSKVHMGNIRRGNWVSPTTDWSLLLLWNWGIPSRFCIPIIKFHRKLDFCQIKSTSHNIPNLLSTNFNQANNTKTLCKNVFNLQFVISVAMTPSLIPRILLAIVWLNDVHQSCWQQQQICYSPSSLQKSQYHHYSGYSSVTEFGVRNFLSHLSYIEEEQVWLGDDSHLHLKCGCHRQEERIDEWGFGGECSDDEKAADGNFICVDMVTNLLLETNKLLTHSFRFP